VKIPVLVAVKVFNFNTLAVRMHYCIKFLKTFNFTNDNLKPQVESLDCNFVALLLMIYEALHVAQ